MYNIAVCDDEEHFLKFEADYIETCFVQRDMDYKIFRYTSGLQLLEAMEDSQDFDMIFLDIDMQDLNGIDTARRLREMTEKAYIVFVTAYIDFSLEGYTVDAFRYLVKEHDDFEFRLRECVDSMLAEINRAKNRYHFKFREGELQLLAEEIMYIESSIHTVKFTVLRNKKKYTFMRYEKLNSVANKLSNSTFCRIHQSYLINMQYINRIMGQQVEMQDGTCFRISNNHLEKAMEMIMNYWGEL